MKTLFHFLLFAALLLRSCAPCHAATVTGTVLNSRGSAVSTNINFTPKPTLPRVVDSAVVTTYAVSTNSATDGTFSVSLLAGNYTVTIGGRDIFAIGVPTGSSSYDWTTLVTGTNILNAADSAYLLKSGGKMTGHLTFNGGTNTITVPSFTTAQRDALSATNGMLIYNTTLGALQRREAGAWTSFAAASGTVSSVAVSSSGSITVTGSPITTSGTITVNLPNSGVTAASYTNSTITVNAAGIITAASSGSAAGTGTVTNFSAGNLSPLFTSSVAASTTYPALTFSLSTQTANTVFAGPTTGAAAAPTFRALVAADIPSLTSTYEVPLTFSAPLSRSVNTISIPASSGSVNGYLSSADWTTFNNKEPAITALEATRGGTAQTTWTTGDLLYSSAANTLAKLAGNTTMTRKFLRQTGDGAASAAPAWDTLTVGDVPTLTLAKLSDAGTLANWALLATNIFPNALTNTGNGATLINSSNAPGPWTLKSLTNDANVSLTATTTNISIGLATTAVTPGSYTLTSITVDAYGRITAASSGSASQFIASATGAGTNTTLTNATIITSARIALNPVNQATNFLVDCSTNQSYKILATNNLFLVFTNVPSTNSEVVINIQIMQDSTGGRSLTFGSATNCLWSGGTQPGITTNANRISSYTFISSGWTNGQMLGSAILNFQ